MKRNNKRAVGKTTKIPEPIMKWTMDNINHTDERTVQTINGMYVYIGEVNRLIKERERMAKANTKDSVLHIFSVVFSFLRGGKKKPKQTCKNCRFNCEDDHTCMNDCNVGSYYAEKGLNRICYEGELWEGK